MTTKASSRDLHRRAEVFCDPAGERAYQQANQERADGLEDSVFGGRRADHDRLLR